MPLDFKLHTKSTGASVEAPVQLILLAKELTGSVSIKRNRLLKGGNFHTQQLGFQESSVSVHRNTRWTVKPIPCGCIDPEGLSVLRFPDAKRVILIATVADLFLEGNKRTAGNFPGAKSSQMGIVVQNAFTASLPYKGHRSV